MFLIAPSVLPSPLKTPVPGPLLAPARAVGALSLAGGLARVEAPLKGALPSDTLPKVTALWCPCPGPLAATYLRMFRVR